DQDPLTFSAFGLPVGAALTPSATYEAVVSWMPSASDIGIYPVVFQVADDGNCGAGPILTDQSSINIVVRATNSAPVLVPVGNQTVPEGQTLTLTLQATDPEGDAVTYSASNLRFGAVLNPVTGVLTWTPNFLQAGTYSGIVLTASDGNLSSSANLTITVTPVNQAPVFVPLFPQSGREGTPFQFTLAAG